MKIAFETEAICESLRWFADDIEFGNIQINDYIIPTTNGSYILGFNIDEHVVIKEKDRQVHKGTCECNINDLESFIHIPNCKCGYKRGEHMHCPICGGVYIAKRFKYRK